MARRRRLGQPRSDQLGRLRRARAIGLLLPGLGMLACSTEPNVSTAADLILAGGESGRLVLIDTHEARIVGRSAETLPRQLAWASWPGEGSAVIAYAGADRRFLAAVDVRTGTLKWEEPLADKRHNVENNGVALWAGSHLQVLPDNRTLVAVSAVSQGEWGIARFDLVTREVTGFIGPMDVAGGSTGVVRTADGTVQLLVLGSRTDLQAPGKHVFIVDPTTFTVVDSVALVPPFDQTRQLVADPVGYGIYLGGDSRVDYLSLEARTVTASASPRIERVGSIAVSPTGSYVAITDPGVWPDSPGTGKIVVLDRQLNLVQEFELGTVSESPYVLVPVMAEFIDGGERLLITSGTASLGPLYGTQRSRLSFVDPATGALLARLEIDDWGGGVILPLGR